MLGRKSDRPAHIGESPALTDDPERVRHVLDLRHIAIDEIGRWLGVDKRCRARRRGYNKSKRDGPRNGPEIGKRRYNH